MRNLICVLASALVLLGTLVGCGAAGDIFPALFTATQMDDLVNNGEATLDAQQLLAKWSFEVARGDISTAGYAYDPPTEVNGWQGTVTATGASFPFGVGDLTMVFTATGDSGPVDPTFFDLSDDTQVGVDVDVSFSGVSKAGAPLAMTAIYTAVTSQNAPDAVSAMLNGIFGVALGGYSADFTATDLAVDIDILTDEITSMIGDLRANIDIPNFPLDGGFDLTGLGDSVRIGYDVAGTTLDYQLSLANLFG